MKGRTNMQLAALRRLLGNRMHGDDGAMIVEFALAGPLIATMFIGTLEFGTAFRDKNTLENSIRQSLRVNTNGQASRWAEANALLSFKAILSGEKRLTIVKVTTWKSSAGVTAMPATCGGVTVPAYTGGAPGGPYGTTNCNAYSADQINTLTALNIATYFNASTATTCSALAWDKNYCPTGRVTQQINADYVGMQVIVDYARLTGIVPNATRITDQLIMRVEPS